MRDHVKKWMINLYPEAWRDRYSEEFLALLEEDTASSFSNILLGAIDAHLRPHVRRVHLTSTGETLEVGGVTMTERMRILLFGQRDRAMSAQRVLLCLVCATLVTLVLAKIKGVGILQGPRLEADPHALAVFCVFYPLVLIGIAAGRRVSRRPVVFWLVVVVTALLATSSFGVQLLFAVLNAH